MGFSILKWVPMGVMGPWGRRRRPQTPMGPIRTHFKMENTICKWEIPFKNGFVHLKSIIFDQNQFISYFSGIPDPFEIHLFFIFRISKNQPVKGPTSISNLVSKRLLLSLSLSSSSSLSSALSSTSPNSH